MLDESSFWFSNKHWLISILPVQLTKRVASAVALIILPGVGVASKCCKLIFRLRWAMMPPQLRRVIFATSESSLSVMVMPGTLRSFAPKDHDIARGSLKTLLEQADLASAKIIDSETVGAPVVGGPEFGS